MRSRLAIIGCLLLTAVVVHTCVRIEQLNAKNSYYLPRTDFAGGNPKWRYSTIKGTMYGLNNEFAEERMIAFSKSRSERPLPEFQQFIGPPYSENEQRRIDAKLANNSLRNELHDWVESGGLLQYLLAPVAIVWAIMIFWSQRSLFSRLLSGASAMCAAVSIGFMLYRGYLTSLGW